MMPELHRAVDEGDLTRVKELIAAGADVNEKAVYQTPLHRAALKNQAQIAEFLLDKGANIHEKSIDNQEAIHITIIQGSLSVLQVLIRRGANLNAPGSFGRRPLHYAFGYPWALDVVRLLVESGADVNAKDVLGGTPLDDAMRHDIREVQTYLRDHGAKMSHQLRG